jgi:SNF2 family DNA or RNA helicase
VGIKWYAHQEVSRQFMAEHPRAFDASEQGTGKTLVQIQDFVDYAKGRALILCPKSLIKPAWANSFARFAPEVRVLTTTGEASQVAHAVSYKGPYDVLVANYAAAGKLATLNASWWKSFESIIIDESDAIKHPTSERSKNIAKIARRMEIRRCLSGTPGDNTICDVWHQYFVLDDGERLGREYRRFCDAVRVPDLSNQLALMAQVEAAKAAGDTKLQFQLSRELGRLQAQPTKYLDRDDAAELVGLMVKDITIRHRMEDCVDLPENVRYTLAFPLKPQHKRLYEKLKKEAYLQLDGKEITPVHAAAVVEKLLQIASGAVYTNDGSYAPVASERYELCLDLVEARSHSIVFYRWRHQLAELEAEAKKRGISYATWDPDHPEIEAAYQDGQYRVLFAHPETAAHGLTLTRGVATIWASPTYRSNHYLQGLKRIHRIGQTQRTETITLLAEDTADTHVFEVMSGKDKNLQKLLEALR